MLNKISIMTAADQLFHNRYLLYEIFSHATGGRRYCDVYSGDRVSRRGLLKLLQLKAQFENNLLFTFDAMDYAARSGHLDTVQWLHTNRSEGCTKRAMGLAAGRGHLHIIKWLHENRSEGCTTGAMALAAVSGHMHVVRWLHENRSEGCSMLGLRMADMNGHIKIVQFLRENVKIRKLKP